MLEHVDDVPGVQGFRIGPYGHGGIERSDTPCGQIHLGFTNVTRVVKRLSVQVARIEAIAVDDAQRSNTCPGEISQHRAAETAGADYQHACCGQLRLPHFTDFAQACLARIVRHECCGWFVRVIMPMLMFVLMLAIRVRAGDPGGIAIDVVLLLPDREAVLDFVDDVAAGAEGFVAMRGRHTYPHCKVANRQIPGTMHAMRGVHAVTCNGFLDDAFAFSQCQLGICLVLKAIDRAPFVAVAHPTLERTEAPAARMLQ